MDACQQSQVPDVQIADTQTAADAFQQSRVPDIQIENTVIRELEEEDAIRRLEDAVDTKKEHIMEISPALVKEAIEGFALFAKDENRGLDIDELAHVFRAVGQNPSDAELREIMRNHDLDANGVLDKEEFEKMIKSYMKPMWQVKEELRDAFRIFDKDGNGLIDKAELEVVLKKFGEPLTHRQSKELIDLMDTKGGGQVDMDDFVNFLCEVDQPDYFQTHYPHNARRKSLPGLNPHHK